MPNVALNGEKSFLICMYSTENQFTVTANKRMQLDAAEPHR